MFVSGNATPFTDRAVFSAFTAVTIERTFNPKTMIWGGTTSMQADQLPDARLRGLDLRQEIAAPYRPILRRDRLAADGIFDLPEAR